MNDDEFKIQPEVKIIEADDMAIGVGLAVNKQTGEVRPLLTFMLTCKEFDTVVTYPIPAEDACDIANKILQGAKDAKILARGGKEFFRKEDERNQPPPRAWLAVPSNH